MSTRFSDLPPDKVRGGYYTPPDIADWLCQWAIRSTDDRILEPSCGDGAFLLAAARRLRQLHLPDTEIASRLTGVEVSPTEALLTSQNLALPTPPNIVNQDFFEWQETQPIQQFSVVIGNPPFVRYHSFSEPARSRAMAAMSALSLRPNKLTNMWVPFVVASVPLLRDGGRLAFVLPAELLQVSYAAQIRQFLLDRFSDIHLVTCNELFFPDAEQEVVLLLADGARHPSNFPSAKVTVAQLPTKADIISTPPNQLLASAQPKIVRHDEEKWLKYFLSQREIDLMRDLRSTTALPLSRFAYTELGIVTGRNEFFVLDSATVDAHQLRDYVVPIVGRASHLQGAILSHSDWKTLADSQRIHLLHLPHSERSSLPSPVQRYIEDGERKKFHLGYKCSIRDPWYTMPKNSVWTSEAFMLHHVHDFPRIIVNRVNATTTDTIYRFRPLHGYAISDIVSMCYTSLTAASAEIEGRSYGGGILNIEPSEMQRLLVPSELRPGLPIADIDLMIRQRDLCRVLNVNDRIVLRDGLGLSKQDVCSLRNVWDTMRERRQSRRKSGNRTTARSTLSAGPTIPGGMS